MLWFQRTSLRNEKSCCVVNTNRKEENSRSRPFVDPSELISVSLRSPWQQGDNVKEERRGVVTNRVVCAGSEIESGERGEKRSRDEAVIFCFCLFEVKHVSDVGDAISLSLPNTACWSLGSAADRWASVSFSCIIINAFVLPDFVAKMLKPAGDFSLAASPYIYINLFLIICCMLWSLCTGIYD